MSDEFGAFEANGLSETVRRAREAAAALEGLEAPAERAAASIEEAFGRAGDSLARSLSRAAADGKVSLAELARAVLTAANAAAGPGSGGLGGGLGAAVVSAVGGLASGSGFFGARADGGSVTGGGAYLVGERGPEVFRPGVSGAVEPMGASAVTVNLTVAGDAGDLIRSEAQIAQMLARATALGARRF